MKENHLFENGPVGPEPPPPGSDRPKRSTPKPPPLKLLSPTQWQGKIVPGHRWMVDRCFLAGTVAKVDGDGGTGKSLILQQLGSAAAIGADWLGLRTEPVKTLAVFAEDDEDELWRRQADIARHYGCELADFDDFTMLSRVGLENVLVRYDYKGPGGDEPKVTAFHKQLRETVLDLGVQILILDTLADHFGGNENFRSQVTSFVTVLRLLALEMNGVVILAAHPSAAGIATGTGTSGTTAWRNKVRSQLYLTRPRRSSEGDQDDDPVDPDIRFLKTTKFNQGPEGGKIRLRWKDGVFVRDVPAPASPINVVDCIAFDNAIVGALRQLIENGARVAADPNSSKGFASLIRRTDAGRKLTHGQASAVQDRLVQAGKIVRVEMGPPSKRYVFVRPADCLYPGEEPGGDK